MAEQRCTALTHRRCHKIQGIVQGVGFRPFVYRLAHELDLTGWVRNSPAGVEIEIQGDVAALDYFENAIKNGLPPLAVVTAHTRADIPAGDDTSFTILASSDGTADIQIAPDSALCSDCLRELFDPSDRRYRYPFITCTNCGPRYSIITGTPYDRPKTTMADFPLCPDCLHEYLNPLDRRFHAQPSACHVCGPQVSLLTSQGEAIAAGDEAVIQATELLKNGAIIAIKGIGGYHLAVDACNHDAVRQLRKRKNRDEKPFAIMVATIEEARRLAQMNAMEERLLVSPEAPIIIVRKRPDTKLSPMLAPGNQWLGLMLPYAPLHHLLFQGAGDKRQGAGDRGQEAGGRGQGTGKSKDLILHPAPCSTLHPVAPCTLHPAPCTLHPVAPCTLHPAPCTLHPVVPCTLHPVFPALVMTSGNISDEPVAFEEGDALLRLSGIADYFLSHNRPIHIRSDDSVMRVFQGRPLFYRRARGYAPRAVALPFTVPPMLATGAELKSAICLASGTRAVLSQHIGDLQNTSTLDSFTLTVAHLSELLAIEPTMIACDLHPDYLSSRFAEETGVPLVRVQHHHAHMASCMAENGLDGDVIAVIFDGTGLGTDGTIWGGEFLVGGYDGCRRAGHFRPVPLPGGDAAIREPWRMAMAYLHQTLGESAFTINHPVAGFLQGPERAIFAQMFRRGINCPLTSSCGRLFDAVAALLNLRHIVSYDGQGAIELEALAETAEDGDQVEYPFTTLSNKAEPLQLDFSTMLMALLNDIDAGTQAAVIAQRFHRTVAAAAAALCQRLAAATGLDRIILSGGVFQNRLLSEMLYTALVQKGFTVFTHRLVPPNDGGIALGQAAVAGRKHN